MATKLLFLRHGEAEGNILRRFHGHYDSSLTPNGRKQVQLLADRLRDVPIDAMYASDLRRAYDTGKAVADTHGLSVHTDPDLREIDGGKWEDVPFAELPVRFPESYHHWTHQPYLLQIPGGESMRVFQERLIRAVQRIVQENPNRTVGVATHGTAIRTLVCFFRGDPLECINQVAWYDNASITEVIADNGKYRVVAEGDNSHLGEQYTTLGKQDWWKEHQTDI